MSTLKIKDADGNNKFLGGDGAGTSSDPFFPVGGDFNVEILKGNVNKHERIDKFGRNSDIDIASTPEDLWGGSGLYTGQPTGAAETMEILSSSANDTAAGTGARTVTIINLLTSTGASSPNITVSLNGTTPVSLGALTYTRATRVRVITAGSGGSNAGDLTLRHTTTTANIFAFIPAGKNQTIILAYTVPLGKTLYIDDVRIAMGRANGSAGSAEIFIMVRPLDEVYQLLANPEITNSLPYHSNREHKLIARTDFLVRVNAVSDNNTIVTGEFIGTLIDD